MRSPSDDCFQSAEAFRQGLQAGRRIDPALFRRALLEVPPASRDAWLDRVLSLEELPDDGPRLPRDCVPYLPCPVDVLLRIVELAPVSAADVLVDIGSGTGRALALVHLLTGARAVGIEIQPQLVQVARRLATQLGLDRVASVEGEATKLAGLMTMGTVFLLYCPFSGERLSSVLSALEPIARARVIKVCAVDLPIPPRPWLALEASVAGSLEIHRSTW